MIEAPARSAGVVGYGRFGRLWAALLAPHLRLRIFDSDAAAAEKARADGLETTDLAGVCDCDVLFLAVPISAFEPAVAAIAAQLRDAQHPPLVVDLLSVKSHPRDVMDRLLPDAVPAMLTHPMFGPDSARPDSLVGAVIVVDGFRAERDVVSAWNAFFRALGCTVVEMSAAEHDRLAASSQGVTHFVGRTLEEFGFLPTPIDTLGTRRLHEVVGQVRNDTWTLFSDLQTYNPATREMRVRLSAAHERIFDRLLPNRVVTDRLLVGIQGGAGSFNEEAARSYLARTPDTPYELVYLHTSEAVLRALHEGSVDRGVFAVHNSTGGMVGESVEAMARYRFAIVEEFGITIAHTMMIRNDADAAKIDTIMTHPQVFAQCHATLARKYPELRQTSGEGDLVDHAKVAELLSRGEIPANVATMGSRVLAELYGLTIIDDNLQDLNPNVTSFLWVERPHPDGDVQ